jgi:hypothetical protein
MTKPAWVPAWVTFKNALIVGLGIAVVYLVWVSWWSPDPVDVTRLLADQRATLTQQFEANVKARDAQIKDLAARLTVSNGKYAALSKRLTEVRNETIVPPKTNKELRDRFVALGFPPK